MSIYQIMKFFELQGYVDCIAIPSIDKVGLFDIDVPASLYLTPKLFKVSSGRVLMDVSFISTHIGPRRKINNGLSSEKRNRRFEML